MADEKRVRAAYRLAEERCAEFGVDTETVLQRLAEIPLSLQCWQGDDVIGFENSDEGLGGGLAVTGNYPGRPRPPGCESRQPSITTSRIARPSTSVAIKQDMDLPRSAAFAPRTGRAKTPISSLHRHPRQIRAG